jgi:hypothetical protein
MRSETFGRLLKAGIGSIASTEGKTAPAVENELGALLGVAAASIQRYKAGHVPPEPRAVAVLAEQCVRRGLMGRIWLQQVLAAAHYPSPETLIEPLFPGSPPRPRPPRVYQNLPAPTYTRFVMRPEAFADVLDGLRQRSAVVLVVGLGGNGKTSLVREVAAACLHSDGDAPRFDAAVWISDKERPGATSLSTVLDEIARTLDYPGLTQLALAERRFEVEQLLRRQPVLLVIDNYETITDSAVLPWLLRLPEPSKALVTSRAYSRAFRNSTVVVELRGMREGEARDFVAMRLRLLRLDGAIRDEAQIAQLIDVTAGNAKAIEIALGVVKYERRAMPLVIEDLRAARGELFDDLFARAWELLDTPAQRVLLAAALFPASIRPEVLAATADIAGGASERAVEQLVDLALLDSELPDIAAAPRLSTHPLVRAFARARLAREPEAQLRFRERSVAWYRSFCADVGARWYDTTALARLDPEVENVQAALDWCAQAGRADDVLSFTGLLGYHAYVRGLWDRQWALNELRLATAQAAGDTEAELFTLTNMLRVRTLQDDLETAAPLAESVELALGRLVLDGRALSSVRHALAMYALRSGDREQGRMLLTQVMDACAGLDPFKFNRARNWYAESLLHEGRQDEARRLFGESLEEGERIGYHRAVMFCQVRLAEIALARGELEEAASLIVACQKRAEAAQDRRHTAFSYQIAARLHVARGEHDAAQVAQATAIDLFTRLGMRRELAQAGVHGEHERNYAWEQ